MIDISNVVSTCFIVLSVLFVYLYYWYKRPKHFPPGPRGVPLLGVLPFVGTYPERVIKKWSKTYGPVMAARFGPTDIVFLNDFESIQKANVKLAHKLSGRPQIPYLLQYTEGYGLVFTDYGEQWKVQRRFGATALRGVGVGKLSLEDRIIEETYFLTDAIRNENGEAFCINRILHNAVSNIICGVGFGRRFDYDDTRFKEILHQLIQTFENPADSALSVLFMIAPILMKIPPFAAHNKRLVDNIGESMTLLKEIISENEETIDEQNPRNFIDAFLLEMKKKPDSSFTRKQLVQAVRDLFQAGSESTASTLHWGLLCLLHHPQVQDKLRKEILDVIGIEGKVSIQKRSDMSYTCAFIEEVLRFRTLNPFAILHSAVEDAQMDQYVIPKGTLLMTNLWAVNNDEDVWDRPELFKPERFLDDKGNFVRSRSAISFSIGPRNCMGEQLARKELFIFFVSMVRRFEFLPDPKEDKLPDIDSGLHGIFFTPKPFKLVAKEI